MEKRLTVSYNESYILLILNYIHKSYDGTIRVITMRSEETNAELSIPDD